MIEPFDVVEEVTGGIDALCARADAIVHEVNYSGCPRTCPGQRRASHSSVECSGLQGRFYVTVSEWCELCSYQKSYAFWTPIGSPTAVAVIR